MTTDGATADDISSPWPVFRAASLDDLSRGVYEYVIKYGEKVSSSEGENLEVRHMQMRLTNPQARLSRSYARGKPFSALGEFCWYLSGSDRFADVAPYVPKYGERAEPDGVLAGAYGPRLRDRLRSSDKGSVLEVLERKRSTRQAVIPIAAAEDFTSGQKDIPCTVSLQFFVRDGRLELAVNMRSNDLVLGMTHDVFAFTMIQEYVAARLGCGLGDYVHSVSSGHIYDRDVVKVASFLDAGWTANSHSMPEMPRDGVDTGLSLLLKLEDELRSGADPLVLDYGVGYWSDLARVLGCHYLARADRSPEITTLTRGLSDDMASVYSLFLTERAAKGARK